MPGNERRGTSTLAPGEVHVWVARPAAVSDASLARCVALLSDEERQRLSRFRFDRHRREAAVSRALVRTTLARYVDRAASAFRYRLGPYGRPYIDPPCGVAFNATNHPDLVACAVCLHEDIGVDVEPVSRGEEILAVASSVFSGPEIEALAALPAASRRDRAVSLWTCKEAYIKARGLGFSAPLREIAIDFPVDQRPALRFLSAIDEPDGWWLETRDHGGFRIAVAVRAANDVSLVVRDTEVVPVAS